MRWYGGVPRWTRELLGAPIGFGDGRVGVWGSCDMAGYGPKPTLHLTPRI